MTKIDIISGFLGAGKTTLIKKLIAESFSGEKLVLIENEFGEIGIDGGFLKDSGIEITEMNSGCICCSLVGDFGTALREVIEKYAPDRIIIEPSGVGKLSDVVIAVEKVATDCDVKINSLVAVADAKKAKIYMKNFGEFFNNQIEAAKTIILSRTDSMKQDRLEACVALLKEHNANATIITTPWDEIDGKLIVNAMESEEKYEDKVMNEEICPECGHVHHHDHDHEHHHEHHDGECCCGHDHEHHGHHHADDVFTSWGVETVKVFDKNELEKVLECLSESEEYGIILRSKGIIKDTNGGWLQFDLVPGEFEIRESSPDITGKLCVIGTKLNEAGIVELFGLNS